MSKVEDAWKEHLKRNGPVDTSEAIRCAAESDLLLDLAVSITDIDWCIKRLRQMKKEGSKSILDICLKRE